ncbi:MAG: hypothetical protein QM589_03115 [Thermomicrobiales bacterium]
MVLVPIRSATIAAHLDEAGHRDGAAAVWRLAGDSVLTRGQPQHVSGDFALDREEFARAIACYKRAGTLANARTDPETAARAAIGLAHCLRAVPDLNASRISALRARAIARRSGLGAVEVGARLAVAMTDYDRGNLSAALATLDETVGPLDPKTPDPMGIRIRVLRSELLYGLARYEEGIEAARAAQDMALATGDDSVWMTARAAELNCLIDLGCYEEAVRGDRDVLRMARRLGDPRVDVLCLTNIALCRIEQGVTEDVDAVLQEAQALVDRWFIPRLESYVAYFAGLNAMQIGDWDRAEAELLRSEAIRLQRGQVGLAMEPQSALLHVAVLRGDREQTAARRAALLALVERRGLEGMEHRGRFALALIDASLMLGDEVMAGRVLEEAVADLERIAASIADPALRAPFLNNVPAHRRLQELTVPSTVKGMVG